MQIHRPLVHRYKSRHIIDSMCIVNLIDFLLSLECFLILVLFGTCLVYPAACTAGRLAAVCSKQSREPNRAQPCARQHKKDTPHGDKRAACKEQGRRGKIDSRTEEMKSAAHMSTSLCSASRR